MLAGLPDALDAQPAGVEPEDPASVAANLEDSSADGRDHDSDEDAEGLAAGFDDGIAEPPADVEPEEPAPAAANPEDPPADGRDFDSNEDAEGPAAGFDDAVGEPGGNAPAVLLLQDYTGDDRNVELPK